jgi:hypothetical protein
VSVHIHELLPAGARPAIERAIARPLSYSARYLVAPGPRPRALVVLGEAHLKLAEASRLGKDVVKCFALRGVETFPRDEVVGGKVLGHLVHAPRVALRALTLGKVKGSTITDAKDLGEGHTVELERGGIVPFSLHAGSIYLAGMFGITYASMFLGAAGITVPLVTKVAGAFSLHLLASVPAYVMRDRKWAWMMQPAIAILTARDRMLADGTVRMFRDHPEPDAAVVVMGRAHVHGYVNLLVGEHGFVPAEL